MLTVDDVRPVLSALRERGIRVDPHFAPECRQLFGNPGIRLNYCRRDGLGVDDVSELLADRGFTLKRLDCAETLICGLCYEMGGAVIVMRRADPLPEEILALAS